MGVPGSSAVYYGGTVAYNTKKSGKLLCGDEELHNRLLNAPSTTGSDDAILLAEQSDLSEEAIEYVKSKLHWTRETALKYCEHIETDFCIAEGGATGPTFRPEGLYTGFAVLAVAGRRSKGGEIEILAQNICRSTHADRELNMRLFADYAAELCLEALKITNPSITYDSGVGQEDVVKHEELVLDRSSHLRSDVAIMNELYERQDAIHVAVRGTDEVLFAKTTELALPTLQNIIEDGTVPEDVLKKRTFLGRLGKGKGKTP